MLKLAKLHRHLGDLQGAARHFYDYVVQFEGMHEQGVVAQDYAVALLFLANHAKVAKRLDDAEHYASLVVGMPYMVRRTQ